MTDDEQVRRDAVRRLEGAFSTLIGEFRRVYAGMAATASPGMLPGTFKVLSVIERRGPVTASWLAEHLAADKGQVSRHISELEALGFVTRTPDPDDGRIRLIAVTEEGATRLTAAREPYEERLHEVLAGWPIESIDRLVELLGALASGDAPES